MTVESTVFTYETNKLDQLCGRVEACLGKLTPEQIWSRHGQNENAVGNLVLHLTGNVRQWILSAIGGAPDGRVRDREFAAREDVDPAELTRRLRSTVDEAVALLRALPPARLLDRITVQAYELTVLEAMLHVVVHFSEHTGQIIFATKFLTGEDLGFYAHLAAAKPHGENTP
jgi:uncharacterized damage-inducible protein DinB